MIRTALTLARKGAHVFPCQPRGKVPATPNGVKDATADLDVIRQWWRQDPNYNIAIATGTASGFFVLDIDGPDAEAELRKLETQHDTLPPSIEAITARGRHVYFKMPSTPVRNSVGKLAPGLDVRGENGYVLAPPSAHPSGRRYEWSVDSAGAIADAPAWLIERITEPGHANGDGATPPSEWRELVTDGVAEGARNDSVTRLCGHLLRRYVHPRVALELIRTWNGARCRPPLSDDEVERIVESVAGLELRRRRREASGD